MKKSILFVAICAGISSFALAEKKLSSEKLLPSSKPYSINRSNGDKPELAHVVKINASQLALKNISLQYELGFHKNMSVALGYSNFLKRGIPSQIYENNNADGYKLPYMKGWAITPEFRFYPGKKEEKPAPHGFYLAPYLRYSKYTLGADYIETDPNTMAKRQYELTGTYKGTSAGLMLGSQWIVGKHFSFDWWIMGAGAGKGKLILNAEGSGLNLTPQQQQELKDDMTENVSELGRFSNGVVKVETTSNSAKVTVSGTPMLSIRGAIVAGFNFGFKF